MGLRRMEQNHELGHEHHGWDGKRNQGGIMEIELSAKECEYLADKTFWDWQRAKIDVMSAPLILKDNQQFVKAVEEAEQFLRELHNKLNPQWEDKKDDDRGSEES